MKPHSQLQEFIEPYEQNIQKLAIQLRDYITDLVPDANELIWDNYNAVAMAYSKSKKLKDAFCHIAIYSKHVNFGFNRGSELTRSSIEFKGTGKLIRHLSLEDFESFPKKEIEQMIMEAVGISEERNVDLQEIPSQPQSLVMSISKKKIRPKK